MRSGATTWLKSLVPFVNVATQQANVTRMFEANDTQQQEKLHDSQGDDNDVEGARDSPLGKMSFVSAKEGSKEEQELLGESVASLLTDGEAASEAALSSAQEGDKDGAATPVNDPATAAIKAPRHLPFPEDLEPAQGRIAVSACLMGYQVRYNGGHCSAKSVFDPLSQVFKFIPVCPEMDIGLGVPRATLRLVSDAGVPLKTDTDLEDLYQHVNLYCPEKDTDITTQMKSYAKAKVDDLRDFGCDGFILKRDSPSCGLSRVKLYQGRGEAAAGRKIYQGMFAGVLVREWPELPVAEEGMLMDEDIRNTFIQNVTCHSRWRMLDGSFNSVVKFHEQHKYILMAQDPNVLKELGQVLAKGPKFYAANNIRQEYYSKFFFAMKTLVARGRHVNVLSHLAGYLKKDFKKAANTTNNSSSNPANNTAGGAGAAGGGVNQSEMYDGLIGSIQDYKEGLVPLVVPLRLLQLLAQTTEQEQTIFFNAETKEGSNPKAWAPPTAKELLLASEYIKGAPRSLKAHTAISQRITSKVPIGVLPAGSSAGGDVE